ncbi:hypothetical protein C8J57DRAFT_749758 [Mycena rebaudengoi]|nr:hypothetical protein C8J57DRAFT_749758 [Mycena rebaudengoi]
MTPPPLPASPMPPRLPYPQDYIPRSSPNLRRVKTAPPPIPPHPYSNRHPSPPRTASAPPPAETVQILPSRSAGPPYAPPPVPEEQAEEAPAPPEPGPPASVDQQPVAAESVRAEELERTPPQDTQAPPQEDDAELAELAAVLALSQAEKLRQEKLRETMQSQEEADLARALEASLSAPSWTTSFSYDAQNYATSAGSSTQPPHSPIPEMNYMDDESFARMLAAQEHDEEIPAFSPRGQSSQLPAEDKPAQAQTETAKSEEANLPVYSASPTSTPSGIGDTAIISR